MTMTITGSSPEPVAVGQALTIQGTGLDTAVAVDSTVGDEYFGPFTSQSPTAITFDLHSTTDVGTYNMYAVDTDGNGSNMYAITVQATPPPPTIIIAPPSADPLIPNNTIIDSIDADGNAIKEMILLEGLPTHITGWYKVAQ